MKSEKRQTSSHWSQERRYIALAQEISEHSSCLSKKVGAIIVREKQVLGRGYNETPRGSRTCSEGGCIRCQMRKKGRIVSGELRELCTCIHAERAAIEQALSIGHVLSGASLIVTIPPCCSCAQEIKDAGIVRVVTKRPTHQGKGLVLLTDLGVQTIYVDS